MNSLFHILLPPRERFTPTASGAVALVVRDLYRASRNRGRSRIYGGAQAALLPDVAYVTVRPSWRRFAGLTQDYARQAAGLIPDTPQTYIEVHNRVEVFSQIRSRHRHSRIALFLHNDPESMGGLATPEARRQVLAMADAVLCVSDYVRRRFLAGIGDAMADRVHVIPNGLPLAACPPPVEPPPPRLLYVGRMVPEKGVRQLAQAIAAVLPRHPGWTVGLIGARRHGDRDTSDFEKSVQALLAPLGERVAWLGQLSNEAVQAQMRDASIVAIPSICAEAFGRVAVEAMANGCAVISSGRGGLPEATGPAALTVDPENPQDIASALDALMSDPDRLAAARREGWQHVRQHLDIAGIASRLDDLRESLTGAAP